MATINDTFAEFPGSQKSFVFPTTLVSPTYASSPQQGSVYGVPTSAGIAGMGPGPSNNAAYGAAAAARPPAGSPVFWLVVLMVIGVGLLGLIAHMEVKRR